MKTCERCGVDLNAGHELVVTAQEVAHLEHTAERCADRLKTQRDEALARAMVLEQDLAMERTSGDLAMERTSGDRINESNDQLRPLCRELAETVNALRAELARKTEALRGLHMFADYPGEVRRIVEEALAEPKAGG